MQRHQRRAWCGEDPLVTGREWHTLIHPNVFSYYHAFTGWGQPRMEIESGHAVGIDYEQSIPWYIKP